MGGAQNPNAGRYLRGLYAAIVLGTAVVYMIEYVPKRCTHFINTAVFNFV
jgi:hypothetical protein